MRTIFGPYSDIFGTRPTRPELQNLVNRRDSSDMQKTRKPSRPAQIRTYFGPKLVVSKSGSTTKCSDSAPSFSRPFRTIFGTDLVICWTQVGREQVRFHNKIFRFCTLFFET